MLATTRPPQLSASARPRTTALKGYPRRWPLTTYRVIHSWPDAPERRGVAETRLPCGVGDVVPGLDE
jgi:hypothetical protein